MMKQIPSVLKPSLALQPILAQILEMPDLVPLVPVETGLPLVRIHVGRQDTLQEVNLLVGHRGGSMCE